MRARSGRADGYKRSASGPVSALHSLESVSSHLASNVGQTAILSSDNDVVLIQLVDLDVNASVDKNFGNSNGILCRIIWSTLQRSLDKFIGLFFSTLQAVWQLTAIVPVSADYSVSLLLASLRLVLVRLLTLRQITIVDDIDAQRQRATAIQSEAW